MRNQFIVAGAVSVLAIIFGASGCGQKKVSECNSLIEVINKGVQSLEKTPKTDDPSGTKDLKSMADSMDKVADEASKVQLSIPELQKYSKDYQQMAKDVAKAARDMAAAVDEKDMAKINAAQAALDKAVKQEDPLVDGINKFCQAP